MKNSFFRILYFLVAGTILFSCKPGQKQERQLPNIVFIVVDDLGWSDLGCYGADLHETPNIDRLAGESYLFTDSYSAAPVCSPTRASIMTGKYPARLHFTIWSEAASVLERKNQEVYRYLPPQTIESLPLEEVTMAEKLEEKGYITAHIGKWHIGDLMHFPENQGFDISVAASQRGAPPTYFYPYKGFAFNELRFVGNLGTDSDGRYFTERQGEYLPDRLTDEAMKMIEDAGSSPFYLNLWFYSVHTPIEAKTEEVGYFKNKTSPELNHQNDTYAAMVKSVDDNIGRLLEKIEDLGIKENTIVILISDNGGFINEYGSRTVTNNHPLRSGKGSLYEGGIRIPTIIYYPYNLSGSQKINTSISTIDFYPTILDIVGLENNIQVDGRSFLSLLNGKADTCLQNRTLFWHYPHYYPTTTPVSALREGKWKLLEYLEDGRTELYNLEDDIGENINLANEEPEKLKILLERLHNWKDETGAQGITLNQKYRGIQ